MSGPFANKSYQVKRMIEKMSEYDYTPKKADLKCVRNFVHLVANQEITPTFPPLNSSLKENGQFMREWHIQIDRFMGNYSQHDLFVIGGMIANNGDWRQFVKGSDTTIPENAAKFMVDLVTAWLLNADKYAESRRKSAIEQLTNMDATEKQIQDIVSDPIKLREFIHIMRDGFLAKLTDTDMKIQAGDPLNMATDKDKAMFKKHEEWYRKGGVDDDEWYPNDGAVHYPLLLVEILCLLKVAGYDTVTKLTDAVRYFMAVCHNAMNRQSYRAGWKQLSQMPAVMFLKIDIGAVIRNYASDPTRNIADQDQQSSPFGRAPMRIARMAEVMFGRKGAFTVLNAPLTDLMDELLKMKELEDTIKSLSSDAKFIKKGAEGLYISFAIAWLIVLERRSLFYSITGRNDQSVPQILKNTVNVSMSAYADLPPRGWALMQNIQGTSSTIPSIGQTPKKKSTPKKAGRRARSEFGATQSKIQQTKPGMQQPGGTRELEVKDQFSLDAFIASPGTKQLTFIAEADQEGADAGNSNRGGGVEETKEEAASLPATGVRIEGQFGQTRPVSWEAGLTDAAQLMSLAGGDLESDDEDDDLGY